MDIEIYVHGVPKGQSFWGKEEDRIYFGNFYNNSSDKVKYLIQTRSLNGKTYCYYNYMIYQNVVDNESRSGSYFGLSIRFDEFCKDFIGIYKILDSVFTAYVLNKVLKVQNGNYKYIISDFNSSSDLMGNIKDAIWKLLESTLTDDSICSLDKFPVGGTSLPSKNLYEVKADDVEACLRKYGMIALSPYYPTDRENAMAKQYESKLLSEKKQYEEKYNSDIRAKEQTNSSLQKSLTSVKEDCEKLQEKIDQSGKIIAQKDSEIRSLKARIDEISRTQKAVKNIDLIRTPIIELADILEGKNTQNPKEIGKQKKSSLSMRRLMPFVNFVVLLFILLMLVTQSFKRTSDVKADDSTERYEAKISSLEEENKELKDKLSCYESNNPTKQNIEDAFDNGSVAQIVSIDVEPYSEEKGIFCKIGKQYTASIENSSTAKGCLWSISGGYIEGNANSNTIKFVPKSNSVILSYENEKGERAIRPLKVTTK